MSEEAKEDVPAIWALQGWQREFSNRRTVAWQMLNQAESIIRIGLAEAAVEARRQVQDERAVEVRGLQERIRTLEIENRGLQHAIEHERRMRQMAEEAKESSARRNHPMREVRESCEEGTLIKVPAPRTDPYGNRDTTWSREWRLGELEELCYRFRLGGGSDETSVTFNSDHAAVILPYAEMDLFSAPPPKPEVWVPDFGKRPMPSWAIFAICGTLLMLGILLSSWVE